MGNRKTIIYYPDESQERELTLDFLEGITREEWGDIINRGLLETTKNDVNTFVSIMEYLSDIVSDTFTPEENSLIPAVIDALDFFEPQLRQLKVKLIMFDYIPDQAEQLLFLESLTPAKIKAALPKHKMTAQGKRELTYHDKAKEILKSGTDQEKSQVINEKRLMTLLFLSTLTENELEILFDYYTQEPERSKFQEFVAGKRELMVTPMPAGFEEILRINSKNQGQSIRESKDYIIEFRGSIDLDAQKIGELLRMEFSDSNYYGSNQNINPIVVIPFNETMEIMKKKVSKRSRKRFSQQLTDEILPALHSLHVIVKEKNGATTLYFMGGGIAKSDPRHDQIIFQFSDAFAKALNTTKNMSRRPRGLFALGDGHNPLPYYVGRKLSDQYFKDANRKTGKNCIISIKTILKACEECLWSYERVQRSDPGQWKKWIKNKLEAALNEIESAELFQWEYCKARMEPVTQREIDTSNYLEWAKLYITFKYMQEEPDDTERLKRKHERIEENKRKKAVKDAEKIIKADKITQKEQKMKG